MYEDILRYYIYIGGTLLATFGSRTFITPRTPLIHRSTSPAPLANVSPPYAVHQKGVWSMVCIPLIYRYLCGVLRFFVSFLVTFRAIFHLWATFGTIFGTPLEKYSCTCGKRVQNLKKHPFAPIYTSAGANGTPRLSVSQRTICEHLQGISSLLHTLWAQIYKTFSKVVSVSRKVPPKPKKFLSKLFFAKDFSTFHSTFGNISVFYSLPKMFLLLCVHFPHIYALSRYYGRRIFSPAFLAKSFDPRILFYCCSILPFSSTRLKRKEKREFSPILYIIIPLYRENKKEKSRHTRL